MPFTDRFIPIPIKIQTPLLEPVQYEDSYMKINPFDVSRYGPFEHDAAPDHESTAIEFKDGQEVIAFMTVKEFEKLLNSIK
jgi:hypothetical protein